MRFSQCSVNERQPRTLRREARSSAFDLIKTAAHLSLIRNATSQHGRYTERKRDVLYSVPATVTDDQVEWNKISKGMKNSAVAENSEFFNLWYGRKVPALAAKASHNYAIHVATRLPDLNFTDGPIQFLTGGLAVSLVVTRSSMESCQRNFFPLSESRFRLHSRQFVRCRRFCLPLASTEKDQDAKRIGNEVKQDRSSNPRGML